MVSTISFIQANPQHSIAASGILTRTVGVKGIDMALVQEPWYREDCIRGLNIPGYILYSVGGKERPRACILARNVNAWMLPGFSCRDLVAILVKYIENGAEKQLVICSVYLPYDSKDPPPSRELEELMRYCESEDLYLIVGCDSNAHHIAWGSTNCNSRGESLLEFLNSSNLEILNRGKESTFCNVSRQEVTDITLGSYGLSESIAGWEVLREPSLSGPMGSDLCSVSTQPPLLRWRDWDGGPSVVWGRPHSLFWASSRRGRNKKMRRLNRPW